ncbi:MerR family transcriptional regulator [Shewanella oncorhynchi]|uniref:MerR family transcriptional regulator n=1 Tax=Shewanella TaxID=22 RepID=UPI0021D911EF|nr:MerR family transcriptional regulator [Shewanella sp. SM69]MCU8040022.1 MerR family transcriptional regulator [Shewanella sp. SM69]
MYIGQAAKQTGLSIKAIRLYEAWGLIDTPARQGRYRIYSAADIRLLLLIKEAKALGIKLIQLKDLLEQGDKHAQLATVQTFLLGIKADFLRQISELEHKVTQLDACIDGLTSCESQLLP